MSRNDYSFHAKIFWEALSHDLCVFNIAHFSSALHCLLAQIRLCVEQFNTHGFEYGQPVYAGQVAGFLRQK